MLDQQTSMKMAGEIAVSYGSWNLTDEKVVKWAVELRVLTEGDARRVVELITKRCDAPPTRKQLLESIDEVRKRTFSPPFDTSLCIFEDGVACRNCTEIHGHPLPRGQVLHGVHHLRQRLQGDEEHLGPAMHPEGCRCGFEPPPGVDVDDALERVAGGLFG